MADEPIRKTNRAHKPKGDPDFVYGSVKDLSNVKLQQEGDRVSLSSDSYWVNSESEVAVQKSASW